MTILLVHKFEC